MIQDTFFNTYKKMQLKLSTKLLLKIFQQQICNRLIAQYKFETAFRVSRKQQVNTGFEFLELGSLIKFTQHNLNTVTVTLYSDVDKEIFPDAWATSLIGAAPCTMGIQKLHCTIGVHRRYGNKS